MILDEYFASIEFLSSGEAGAEFGLSASASNASIPLAHKLDSSPMADSGVDLNVMSQYSSMTNQSSVDVDDVFTDDTTGMKINTSYKTQVYFEHYIIVYFLSPTCP